MFVDEKGELILLVIYNYFSAVKKKWPQAWDNSGRGNILNKSTGLIALFRLLKDVYNHLDRNPKTTIDKYFKLLDRVELQDNAFNPKEYIPGSSGQSLLYKELKTQMGI